MKETEVLLDLRPVDMVADAMMVAVNRQVKDSLFLLDGGQSLRGFVALATREKCRMSSAYVLSYLEEKYPKMFPVKLLIEVIDPYKLFLKQGWSWHDYFLVLGKDGYWYAGSPANFGKSESEERITNLIYGRNLAVVMNEIQILEGGQWPEAREIYKLISDDENLGVKVFGEGGNRKIDLLLVSREMTTTNCRRISVKI